MTLSGFVDTVAAATGAVPPGTGFDGIGFASVPPNLLDPATGLLQKDLVSVPPGYVARVLAAWGDPLVRGAPEWDVAATQDAAAQEKQIGMHHDGMHYFPFPARGDGTNVEANRRGLLCVNHEYTDENQLHGAEGLTGGMGATIAKVRKSQAAHGVSVMEVANKSPRGGDWAVRRDSPYNRRITGNTPMRLAGAAAGNALLKSRRYEITPDASVDTGTLQDGFTSIGTLNNCANGYTPWGTYIACEENWNGYFGWSSTAIPPEFEWARAAIQQDRRRYGLAANGFGYLWHTVDPRFDGAANPLEPFNFGWRVEVDPFDPNSTPVKRTAMGRFKCESAEFVVDDDDRVAVYMGDDERNEYIYKFVCARRLDRRNRQKNLDMLDHGTLYVARFDADGTGSWLPLVWGQNGLTPENGFADQAEVLIKTRQAADRVGATMMDRPEWTAARPRVRGFSEIEVYCTLTNNSRRGNTPVSVNPPNGSAAAASANPPVDAANPRPDNDYGHIIRWREAGRSVASTSFMWDLFVQCGDKLTTKTLGSSYTPGEFGGQTVGYQGNINGDDYGAPDGLWFDRSGRLWIQTDQAGDGLGDWINIGGNVMMCADPNTRQTRRFLTSPTDCEVTGVTMTPDQRTMFINIQHPGDRGTPAEPTKGSNWPHTQGYGPSGRPRSATVVITKIDGGVIGT